MQNYKSGGHTIWDCKYHLVRVTKYRYPVLDGDVGLRCRGLLREIARSKEMIIYVGSINRDHVHMLIEIPPNLSVSKAVQFLKGKSSYKMLGEFPQQRKRYWGQHLWVRGYWVASSGNVTDEVWKVPLKRKVLSNCIMRQSIGIFYQTSTQVGICIRTFVIRIKPIENVMDQRIHAIAPVYLTERISMIGLRSSIHVNVWGTASSASCK